MNSVAWLKPCCAVSLKQINRQAQITFCHRKNGQRQEQYFPTKLNAFICQPNMSIPVKEFLQDFCVYGCFYYSIFYI